MGGQLAPIDKADAQYAILVRDNRTGYFAYDFAWPRNDVWYTFNHGNVTGTTYSVVWSCPLPWDMEELNYLKPTTAEKDN